MRFEFLLPRNTKQKSLNMVLDANDRWHAMAKAKITSNIRSFAAIQVVREIPKDHVPFSHKKPCEVVVTVFSPTKSRLDPPNLYPTVKAIVDGMTDMEIWVDDNHAIIKTMAFKYGGVSGVKGHYKFVFDIKEVER